MKQGFTLAEVLITLGIIGVVAAMTMPVLIAKYQDRQFRVAYKKAYSDVNAAFNFIVANGEYSVPIGQSNPDNGVFFADGDGFGSSLKLLAKQFKTVKTCYDNNADECFVLDGECGRKTGAGGCPSSSFAFVDASGRQWYMYNNKESGFIVDTNGNKNPNKLGKDRFVFQFPISGNTSGLYQSKSVITPCFHAGYKNYADIIVDENGDMTSKQRWCPSGECYWTTWLLD